MNPSLDDISSTYNPCLCALAYLGIRVDIPKKNSLTPETEKKVWEGAESVGSALVSHHRSHARQLGD